MSTVNQLNQVMALSFWTTLQHPVSLAQLASLHEEYICNSAWCPVYLQIDRWIQASFGKLALSARPSQWTVVTAFISSCFVAVHLALASAYCTHHTAITATCTVIFFEQWMVPTSDLAVLMMVDLCAIFDTIGYATQLHRLQICGLGGHARLMWISFLWLNAVCSSWRISAPTHWCLDIN